LEDKTVLHITLLKDVHLENHNNTSLHYTLRSNSFYVHCKALVWWHATTIIYTNAFFV